MKNAVIFGLLTLGAVALAACGGGSGSSSSSSSSSGGSSSGASSSGGGSVSFAPVAGLYNTSRTVGGAVDENYLYISATGEITAYNYLGDGVNEGDNCYREATGSEVNAGITGQTLTFNQSAMEYQVTLNGNPVFWRINSSNQITHVGWGGLVSGAGLTTSSAGMTLVIVPNKTTSIAISDIEAALCD